MKSEKIPIIMCIDVEPDGLFIDRAKPLPWRGYEGAYEFFAELRPKLSQMTGAPVHYSWFYRIDPQVAETYGSPDWPITHYPKYVEDFMRHGDSIGLHIHAYRWEEKINNWVDDRDNQKWVNYCVEMGFDCYQRLFKRGCDSFRFGAHWIDDEILNLVEKLGARFDLTVEPGYKDKAVKSCGPEELYRASVSDLESIPHFPVSHFPYRPSKLDFRKADPSRKEGLWIIPLSTGKVSCRYGRLETTYRRIFSPRDLEPKTITLNLARGSNGFRKVMNDLLENLERPFLNFVIRCDICGSESLDPMDGVNMKKNLEHVMMHPLRNRFIFSTPAEMMSIAGYLNGQEVENRS